MMKKIFALVLMLVLGKISYSQYPLQQNLGSDSTIVISKGALQSRLINVTYTDTAAANLQRIRQYPAALIATTTGGLNLWVRNATATGWLPVATGSGNNIYTINGTLLGNRTLTGGGYPLTFTGLDKFVVSADSVRFTTGDLKFGLNTDSASLTKKISYSGNYRGDYKQFTLVDKGYVDSVVASSPAGTVTSIATNNGSGITGGTITSTGTLAIDTTNVISTKANVTSGLAGKLNISDTASMLGNYINNVGYGLSKAGQVVLADSATLSAYYLRRKDSLTTTNPLGYVTKKILADTAAAIRSSSSSGFVPYTGATQNVDLGQFGLKTKYVEFDTSSQAVTDRRLQWSNDEGTLQFGMTNGATITQRLGLEQFARVKNVQGSQINKGQAVYIYGASGDRASVKLADNRDDSTSSKTLGVAAEDIPINGVGLVGTFGQVGNLNLSAFSPGNILYLDSVPGQLTATKPQAPYNLVFIGVVERANSGNGLLFVNPQNGYELEELHNVRITSPVRNNAILVYDSTRRLWVDTTVAQAGIAVTQVNTNAATGITGGPITTTGTISADTLLLSTRAWRQKGIDSVAALANTKIGGSLISGYLTKATGTSTIDTSQIYQSNGLVGIGTTSPARKLDVNGDALINGLTIGRGNYNYLLNVAVGYAALSSNSSGAQVTAIGAGALQSNTSGSYNTALGYNSLYANTSGQYNTALGFYALNSNSSGSNNTAIGRGALESNTSSENVAIGSETSKFNTTGTKNVAIGNAANAYITTGSNNTALGHQAGRDPVNIGQYNQTPSNSLYLGYQTRAGGNGNNTNEIVIGASTDGNGSNSVTLGNTSITKTVLRENVGIGTTAPDSALTVVNGAYFQRGVRMSGLPAAVGTKALRIDASGTISTADTLIDAGGTVTSVATNNGTGITGGTITTSGTLAIDTLLISTRAWRQKGVDSVISVMGSRVNGTTNYVSKFTGTNTIGNSQIFDNATSVGVGTAFPSASYKLDVNGNINVSNAVNYSQGGTKYGWTYATAGAMAMEGLQGADISLGTGSGAVASERMVIKNSGIVGIGITPDSMFTVAQGTHLQRGVRMSGLPSAVGTKSLRIDASGTVSVVDTGLYVPTSRTITINGTTQDLSADRTWNVGTVTTAAATGGGQVAFFNGSTVLTSISTLYFDGVNKLAIGNSSPDSMLSVTQGAHIQRGVRLSGLPTAPGTRALRVDANGTLSVSDTLTNGISGSGTTNYIPKFTSSSAIGNSLLQETGTNVTLENNQNGSTWFIVKNTNAGNGAASGLLMTNDGGDLGAISLLSSTNSPANALFIRTLSTNSLVFGTNSNPRMTLDASGNLGLGVTPSAWSVFDKVLQVGGASVSNYQNADNTMFGSNMYYGGSPANFRYITNGTASLYRMDAAEHKWFNAPSGTAGNAISFTQAMTLTAAGDLMVGRTTTSNSRLQVTGIANSWSQDIQASTTSGQSYGLLLSAGTTSADAALQIRNAAGTTQYLYVRGDGNVGIGTTSPITKLQVSGSVYSDITASNNFLLNSTGTNYGTIQNDAADRWSLGTTTSAGTLGTSVLTWNKAGNLGLGVTPSAWGSNYTALQLIYGSLGKYSAEAVFLSANAHATADGAWKYTANGQAGLYYQTDGKHVWYNAGTGTAGNAISFTQAMTLDASGRLAVGTTSIINDNLLPIQINAVATTGQAYFASNNAGGYGLLMGYDNANGYARIRNVSNTALTFETNNIERIRLDASGNLGLGVTPSAWGSNVKAIQNIKSFWLSSASRDVYFGTNAYFDNTNYRYIDNSFATSYGQYNGEHIWYTAPSGTAGNAISFTQAMTLDASGNLVVGTTTANSRLHVVGSSLTNTFRVTDATNYTIVMGYEGTGNIGMMSTLGSTAKLALGTNSLARLTIDGTGNVGIGTTNPTSLFHTQTSGLLRGRFYSTANASFLDIENASSSFYIGTDDASGTQFGVGAYSSVLWRSGAYPMIFATNNAERMRITSGGEVYIGNNPADQGAYNLQVNGTGVWGAGAYVNGSDSALKYNIQPLEPSLDIVKQMKPVTFEYQPFYSKDTTTQTGFIAQDLQRLLADKVYKNGIVKEGGAYLGVAYENIIPLLVKAIQEQQTQIDQLKAQLNNR